MANNHDLKEPKDIRTAGNLGLYLHDEGPYSVTLSAYRGGTETRRIDRLERVLLAVPRSARHEIVALHDHKGMLTATLYNGTEKHLAMAAIILAWDQENEPTMNIEWRGPYEGMDSAENLNAIIAEGNEDMAHAIYEGQPWPPLPRDESGDVVYVK